ncbi:MAG: DUF998 domain-containing protein [Halobacteriota archaeon]
MRTYLLTQAAGMPNATWTSNRTLAGFLIFVGAAQCVLALLIAEALFPGYSVANNAISDLGAYCRAHGTVCQVYQPSATVFNVSMVVLGTTAILGVFFGRRVFGAVPAVLIALAGVGAIGVGLFPETSGGVHTAFSYITFGFGGLAVLSSVVFERSPLRYLSVVLGVIVLAASALLITGHPPLDGTWLGLGYGAVERLIAYPLLIWLLGLGGSLLCTP